MGLLRRTPGECAAHGARLGLLVQGAPLPMPTSPKLPIALLILSTFLLVAGVLLPWWTGSLEDGGFKIDLRWLYMCLGENCYQQELAGVGGGAQGWAKLGSSVFAASIFASALNMWNAVQIFRTRKQGVVLWVNGATNIFTGLLAIVFVLVRPDSDEWIPSYGLASSLVGALLGAIAVTIAASSSRRAKR